MMIVLKFDISMQLKFLFEFAILLRKIRNNVKLQQEETLTSAYFPVSAEPVSFPARTVITAGCVDTCMLAMMKALRPLTFVHI